MFITKNPLENIEVRVMASGGADYLPIATAMHCKKVDKENGNYGHKLADMYQDIGSQDPLIITAPNPFAWGTFNVYPSRAGVRCSDIMCDANLYFTANIKQTTFNLFPDFNADTPHHQEIFTNLLVQNTKYNTKCKRDVEYQEKIKTVLKSISTGYQDSETEISYEAPFKDCPKSVKDAIETYICDKFLSVIRDPIRSNEFINTGYYGIAIGLGARYDLKKIEAMIKELDPKKAGVQLDDINAVKEYLKGSRLYNELMKTNRYLGLICVMNLMLNKSVNRNALYTDPNAYFVKNCKEMIKYREKISLDKYESYIKPLSDIYTQVLEIVDRTEYVSKTQENALSVAISKCYK